MYDVNRAIQNDQVHRDKPEANAHARSQGQRDPDGSPDSWQIDHENS